MSIVSPDNENMTTDGPRNAPLTLRIVRKDRNSTFLSIQTFIQRQIVQQQSDEIDKLWKKYRSNEANSLLIRKHKITYQTFKGIVVRILRSYKPYSLQLVPNQYFPTSKGHDDEFVSLTV